MLNDERQERKASLEKELQGYWAQDIWCSSLMPIAKDKLTSRIVYYRFETASEGVNQELKYALKRLFSEKQWQYDSVGPRYVLNTFVKCFNEKTPNVHSLIQKPLSFWEEKLMAYLAEQGLSVSKQGRYLTKTGFKTFETQAIVLRSNLRGIWGVVADYYDLRDEWDKDVIDARRVGLFIGPGISGYRLNLSTLTPPWLREATRQCLRYHANRSYGTLAKFLSDQKRFSQYLAAHFPQIQPEQIERRVLTQFINGLYKRFKPSTVNHALSNLKLFLETCAIHGFAAVPDKTLIFKEDFITSRKSEPKFITDDVLQQILANLDRLPEPYRLMVLILEQTGCRVGEALALTVDCLSLDTAGDYFLKRWASKQNKYINVPIKKELALLIQAQAQRIRAQWGNEAHYLFPNKKGQTLERKAFEYAFTKWAIESDIRDQAGQLSVPHFHQFRHTVGTRLLNNGMPQYSVMQFLGHDSPDMTAVYAHLHDETAKQALNTFLTQQDSHQLQTEQLIDATGKVVNLDDLWLKANLKAQALPNGICALPVILGECPHANACLSCQHFCTSRAYLPVHQKQLASSEQAEVKANEAGKTLQAQIASNTCAKLRTLINQLENSDVNSTDLRQATADHVRSDERD